MASADPGHPAVTVGDVALFRRAAAWVRDWQKHNAVYRQQSRKFWLYY